MNAKKNMIKEDIFISNKVIEKEDDESNEVDTIIELSTTSIEDIKKPK